MSSSGLPKDISQSLPQWQKFHTDEVKFVQNLTRIELWSNWSMQELNCFSYCLRMTAKDKSPQKVKCKYDESTSKQSILYLWKIFFFEKQLNFAGVCCRRKQNSTIIIQEKHNWTNLYLQPHDYLIKVMLTLIYVIGMEFPSLRHRPLSCERPLVARIEETVFAGYCGGRTHFFWNYTFVTHCESLH